MTDQPHIYFYGKGNPDYQFLSNFWWGFFYYNHKIYRSVEHFYQASKATNNKDHEIIRTALTPATAKRLGREIDIRDDWEDIKVSIMLTGLRLKFEDKVLKRKLLDTKDAILHENSPNDYFWGVKGKDMLGKLLMKVRDEIRQEEVQ
jgi:hypothetical protein